MFLAPVLQIENDLALLPCLSILHPPPPPLPTSVLSHSPPPSPTSSAAPLLSSVKLIGGGGPFLKAVHTYSGGLLLKSGYCFADPDDVIPGPTYRSGLVSLSNKIVIFSIKIFSLSFLMRIWFVTFIQIVLFIHNFLFLIYNWLVMVLKIKNFNLKNINLTSYLF